MVLRRASIDDLDTLHEWRNDPLTRAASHRTHVIPREEHEAWLKAALADAKRQVYIAEENGIPVGTVRAEFDPSDASYELSWTVAPQARGRGVGKQMVALVADRIKAAIKAQIKAGNTASVPIAEGCGMRLEREESGVMYYRRPPL